MDTLQSIQFKDRRTEVLYEQSKPTIVASLVAAVIMISILSGKTNGIILTSWFFTFLFLSIIRLYAVFRYSYSIDNLENQELWRKWYILGAFLSGMMWGATGYLFMPELDIMYTGFVTLCICGLVAGSIPSYSVYHSVYYSFNLPAITPLLFYFISKFNSQYFVMMVLTSFFVLFMFFIETRTHKMIMNLLKLKFDTSNLLLDLDEKKQEAITLQKKWENATNKFYFLQKEFNRAKSRISELEAELNTK